MTDSSGTAEIVVGDTVVLKGARPPVALWTVHDIHKPTVQGEKLLLSVRPEGKPRDRDCEGWPAHRFHTIEASKVRKA